MKMDFKTCLLIVVIVISFGLFSTPTSFVFAALGDQLRSFIPAPSGNGRAVAFDPATGTLYYTITTSTNIFITDANNATATSINPSIRFGALSWDPKRGVLWGSGYQFGELGKVYQITTTGAKTLQFTFIPPGGNCYSQTPGFSDGLAYDEGPTLSDADDTLWLSDDAGFLLHHLTLSGALIQSFQAPNNPRSGNPGCNTGIAVDGDSLWLALQSGPNQAPHDIVRVAKSNPTQVLDSFGFSNINIPGPEDLELDLVTVPETRGLWSNQFGSPNRLTLWDIGDIGRNVANLAKELLSSDYLYGGKGWDYNVGEFVAPITIKSGYNFWNQSAETPGIGFGTGVDCSGLVMWSYNRSFDPTKSRFNNFVKAEGADEQFRENTELITEAQLLPGDVLFSDFDSNGFIDHVAMFVGESGGFDVVSAVDEDTGIVGRSKNDLKKPETGFVAFKRVVSVLPPKALVTAGSPIDLVVTDPDGFTITPETIIPSDLEFLRQIPGVLYYSEMEQGTDGRPIDHVYSYTAKTGDYLITVLPEPDALSTETFSLSFTTDLATTTVLAENILISDIPDQPYVIRISEEGAEKIIPAKVNITPKTLNLGNKGVFSAIIEISRGFGASVADIDVRTVSINNALPAQTTVAAGKFLVATFRTQDLKNIQSGDEIELQISGTLNDGTVFEGSDTIRIISQGRFLATLGQFSQLAGVLGALQSLLSQLLELLQP